MYVLVPGNVGSDYSHSTLALRTYFLSTPLAWEKIIIRGTMLSKYLITHPSLPHRPVHASSSVFFDISKRLWGKLLPSTFYSLGAWRKTFGCLIRESWTRRVFTTTKKSWICIVRFTPSRKWQLTHIMSTSTPSNALPSSVPERSNNSLRSGSTLLGLFWRKNRK